MNTPEQQKIIIYSASALELESVKRYIQRDSIRFGIRSAEFELQEEPARLIWTEINSIYLKDGHPWAHPFNLVVKKFPNIGIEVDYLVDQQMKKASFGLTESQPEDTALDKVGEKTQKEDAYFNGIQEFQVDNTPGTQENTGATNTNEALVPESEPLRRELHAAEPPAVPHGVEVLPLTERQVDAAKNQASIVQQQPVEAQGNATEAENLAKQAEDRIVAIEAQLDDEKRKRKEAELELKNVRDQLEKAEELKSEVENQKEAAERRAKKAEVNAVIAEEEVAQERFMTSMLAIKAEMAEQSANSDPNIEDASKENAEEQNLNSLSRTAHLIRQDKDAGGMNAFHEAAKAGSLSKFSADELNVHNLLSRDDEGNTALHWAAAKGILGEIPGHVLTPHNLLLKNNHRATCLHLAALGGCLMDMPADILTTDNVLDETDTGCTCLHLAAINGRLVDIPDQFFTFEALNMQNRNVQTPIEVADEGGHGDKVPGVLRAVAADPNVSASGKLMKFKESIRKMRWQM